MDVSIYSRDYCSLDLFQTVGFDGLRILLPILPHLTLQIRAFVEQNLVSFH